MPRRSQIFAQPLADSTENSAGREPRGMRRFGALGHREEQQARRGGEGGAVRRFGEPLDARRSPDPDLLVENEPGELAHAMQLAGAAGQPHAAAGNLVKAARLKPVSHHLEGLLDTRRDDADQEGFRYMADM